MKKNSLKAIVISDITALALSVVMLATMSFAWFFSSFTDERIQSVSIAKFEVRFDETGEVVGGVKQSQTIEVTAAYPRTFEQAKQAYLGGENNVYAFEVENFGALSAMVRMSAKTVSDSNAAADGTAGVFPLAGQISYALRFNASGVFSDALDDFLRPAAAGGSGAGCLFTTVQDASNVSLQDYFNSLLLSEITGSSVDADKRYRAKNEYILAAASPAADGTYSGGGKLYFQLMVWLDERATVESTGVEIGGAAKTFKFGIVMHAMQAEGGAYFTQAEINADEV